MKVKYLLLMFITNPNSEKGLRLKANILAEKYGENYPLVFAYRNIADKLFLIKEIEKGEKSLESLRKG